jgi:hypothetical protein
MIMESSEAGAMAWVTATSGTCLSVFKPVYFGVALPHMGPVPGESFTEGSLWWKHEKLHRRAMADFRRLGPEIRASFEELESGWFAAGMALVAAPAAEKAEFMADCWRAAERLTDRWIGQLERRNATFAHDALGGMWRRFNAAAAMPL